jgi:D-alanyl-D-alanine carboxypeptidase
VPIRTKHDVPALGAVILRDGAIVAAGATGVRKRSDQTPITVDDVWHLGSCTKAMTATLLTIVAKDGKLSLVTTLAEAFPEHAEAMHAEWRQVTLRQVLEHRGGFEANLGGALALATALAEQPRQQRAALLGPLFKAPPSHAPGGKMLYSNLGYTVVGAALERHLDVDFDELMRARLFAPLGMQSAGFGPPGNPDAIDQPWGHRPRGRHAPVRPGASADNPAVIGPAGRAHASLRDWAKFIALHLGQAKGDAALLDAETLATLHDAGDDDYALGWGKAQQAGVTGPILTHAGSNTMWFALVWAAPGEGWAVLAACNQGDDNARDACRTVIKDLTATARQR